ncbi:MAG: peptidylprolyl isomerase [Proteobacteria bacterium]|jgi:FKBP-type peptidyl-prolyl cis-trans isomerase SlyD|nr:peptidylprolyl isomerase [Pseudomonadota bacterium]
MSQHQVISFHYHLTDASGTTIDKSDAGEPLAFLSGSGQIIAGLESVLIGMNIGEKRKVEVEPSQAYGEKDLGKIITVKRSQLPEGDIKPGDMFRGHNDDVVTVTAVNGDSVVLDSNHPLAGQKLIFDVEIATKRAATASELEHGHAHGGDGHHH